MHAMACASMCAHVSMQKCRKKKKKKKKEKKEDKRLGFDKAPVCLSGRQVLAKKSSLPKNVDRGKGA